VLFPTAFSKGWVFYPPPSLDDFTIYCSPPLPLEGPRRVFSVFTPTKKNSPFPLFGPALFFDFLSFLSGNPPDLVLFPPLKYIFPPLSRNRLSGSTPSFPERMGPSTQPRLPRFPNWNPRLPPASRRFQPLMFLADPAFTMTGVTFPPLLFFFSFFFFFF